MSEPKINTIPPLESIMNEAVNAHEIAKEADASKDKAKKRVVKAMEEQGLTTYYCNRWGDEKKLIKAGMVVQQRSAVDKELAQRLLSPEDYERVFNTKKTEVTIWSVTLVDRHKVEAELD